jgi:hypothetical protein
MPNFKIHKLSLLLAVTVIFLNTCTTSTAQSLQFPAITTASVDKTGAPPTASTGVAPGDTAPATPEQILAATPTVYLPLVSRPEIKFFGIYLDQYWNKKNVSTYMTQVDQGAGKKHTSVGWFIDLEDTAFTEPVTYLPGNNLYSQLEELWKAGYISFINLGTNATAADILSQKRDSEIGYAAEFYKAWIDLGQGRRAMIAPMQEMNGEWTAYGNASSSEEFKQAYHHILDIFTQKGVTRDQVWWVFAPNGYNDPVKPERVFENYYPGDDVVDIVGFSSYNYGFCPAIPSAYRRWESYSQIFEPYIARMQAMAPTKPIIIAETSSTPWYGADGEGNPLSDPNRMNQWLIENYASFTTRSGVIGVFYFSFPLFDGYDCDIEINPNGVMLSGYGSAVSPTVYQYLNPTEMDSIIP